MSKVKAATVGAQRVQSFIERLENLAEEREAIQSDIREVFKEAHGVGYDVKTLRWLLAERKIDVADRDERDQIRDTYAMALGMAVNLVRVEGLSLREAAKKSGASKSSIQRALAVPASSHETVPHTPDGVVIEGEDARQEDAAPRPELPAPNAQYCEGEDAAARPVVSALGPGCAESATHPSPQPEDNSTDPGCAEEGCRLEGSRSPSVSSGTATTPGRLDTSDHRIEAPPSTELGAVASACERVATSEMPDISVWLQRVEA